jgi:hypothetical protein
MADSLWAEGEKSFELRLLQNDDNGRFVIPGKRSATRNPCDVTK